MGICFFPFEIHPLTLRRDSDGLFLPEIIGGFARAIFVQYLCMELNRVVQLSQHVWVATEEDVEAAVHTDGGYVSPQSSDLDGLPLLPLIRSQSSATV